MAWQAALTTTNMDPISGSETIIDANGGTSGPLHITNTIVSALSGSSVQVPPRTTGSPIS